MDEFEQQQLHRSESLQLSSNLVVLGRGQEF